MSARSFDLVTLSEGNGCTEFEGRFSALLSLIVAKAYVVPQL
jgi:hypothetical protein